VNHNAVSVCPPPKAALFAERLRRSDSAALADMVAGSLAVLRILVVFVELGAMRLQGLEFR